jgi:hypothetical protein
LKNWRLRVNLLKRLMTLERSNNSAPMLTMTVNERPNAEQAALIDRCTKAGRKLLVFIEPYDSAWMPGAGVPPWEVEHGNA